MQTISNLLKIHFKIKDIRPKSKQYINTPTDRCIEDIMFLGCPSVSACVRACDLLARYLTNQWTEFHQTLYNDVVEGTDNKLIWFEGRGVNINVTAR